MTAVACTRPSGPPSTWHIGALCPATGTGGEAARAPAASGPAPSRPVPAIAAVVAAHRRAARSIPPRNRRTPPPSCAAEPRVGGGATGHAGDTPTGRFGNGTCAQGLGEP